MTLREHGRTTAANAAKAAKTAGQATKKAGMVTGRAAAKGARATAEAMRANAASVHAAAQGLLASDLSSVVNSIVQGAVKGAPTIYDKAMDAGYAATHIGGGCHRLFDGGHTISGAWTACRGASADGSMVEDMLGCVQGLMRDVSTPRGLPLANWDKETFDVVAENLQSNFGIPKSWFADMVSYDAAEILGGAVGAASVAFGWNKADTETFGSLAVSMGLSATLSANPLLLTVSVVALGRAFHKAHYGDGDYADVAAGALKGAVTTGASMAAVAAIGAAGGPAGVALIAGIAASALASQATKNVDSEAVYKFVRSDVLMVAKQHSVTAAKATGKAASAATHASRTAATGQLVLAAKGGRAAMRKASEIRRRRSPRDEHTETGCGESEISEADEA